jgi:rhodanese-related sulfurtransferase/DNA-binding transcriptional ArsR family regulator
VSHREFKDRIYGQFARIGTALASEKRLELLDLLGQAPRSVEALAREADLTTANASQHLQVLKAACLVETERRGTKVFYRLASDEVLGLWLALRTVAETRLADVSQIVHDHRLDGAEGPELGRDELEAILGSQDTIVLDVRPDTEYTHGHLPGAVSIPIESLPAAVSDLPREARIVVYCRGRYCLFADEALSILRGAGFDVVRLEGGWPEWLSEGRPTASRR